MATRRKFIRNSLGVTGLISLAPTLQAHAEEFNGIRDFRKLKHMDAHGVAGDEDAWEAVAKEFTVDPTIIDLNNASISPQPKIVQRALIESYEASNRGPSYYSWNVANKNRETIKTRLASIAGVEPSTIVLTRNATEALDIVIFGLPLERGDEVVMTRFDYPNMVHAWKQRALRDGIKINWVDLQLPSESDSAIVNAFVKATTPKTKVWHITHMINWTGQILPAKKLCSEAAGRNIISVVDGAQSFAQFEYSVSDINPDFFAASLHKWLSAPFGLGMLYMKNERVSSLWPTFPNDKPTGDDVSKFESIGTRFFPAEMAISAAVDFHEGIGIKQKQERLRYLKNYWCERLAKYPRVKLYTSLQADYSCGIASFSVDGGISTDELRSRLFTEFKVIVTNARIENIDCIRVSPGIYTLTKHLDTFLEGVATLSNL